VPGDAADAEALALPVAGHSRATEHSDEIRDKLVEVRWWVSAFPTYEIGSLNVAEFQGWLDAVD
jgi:hypothetical protein